MRGGGEEEGVGFGGFLEFLVEFARVAKLALVVVDILEGDKFELVCFDCATASSALETAEAFRFLDVEKVGLFSSILFDARIAIDFFDFFQFFVE